MKRKIANVLFALVFLAGFGIFAYPAVSDQWNAYRQNQLISTYDEVVARMEEADYSREWEAAGNFNSVITENYFYGDAFGDGETELEDTEYWKVLNAAGDGVMGYMTIPKIHVRLAIYHGVADDVLQTGSWRPIAGFPVRSCLRTWIRWNPGTGFTSISWMRCWLTRWTRFCP